MRFEFYVLVRFMELVRIMYWFGPIIQWMHSFFISYACADMPGRRSECGLGCFLNWLRWLISKAAMEYAAVQFPCHGTRQFPVTTLLIIMPVNYRGWVGTLLLYWELSRESSLEEWTCGGGGFGTCWLCLGPGGAARTSIGTSLHDIEDTS